MTDTIVRNKYFRKQSDEIIHDLAKWIRTKRKHKNRHVNRMNDNRLPKMTKNKILIGRILKGQ